MTYRKVIALAVITLIGTTAFDVWWVVSGKFGTNSYVPGIYPFFCVLLIIGLRKLKGLWDLPPKDRP